MKDKEWGDQTLDSVFSTTGHKLQKLRQYVFKKNITVFCRITNSCKLCCKALNPNQSNGLQITAVKDNKMNKS